MLAFSWLMILLIVAICVNSLYLAYNLGKQRQRMAEVVHAHSEMCMAMSSVMSLYGVSEVFIPEAKLVYEGTLNVRVEPTGLRITTRTVAEGIALVAREECDNA